MASRADIAGRSSTFTALFVRRPILAIVVNSLIVIAGLAAALGIEVRELPDVDRPVITVTTTYDGAAPETIDREVTGVIDYGAMKIDHPAVDLARLLGDLADGDPDRLRVGLDAYRAAGGPVAIDPQFVSVLDRTGLVCAVIHWINRREPYQIGHAAIAERVTRLVGRLADL